MAKKRVVIRYPQELLKEPIVYTLGQEFGVITNICRADIREDQGDMLLDLEGEEKPIEDAIAWMMSRGVRVEALP